MFHKSTQKLFSIFVCVCVLGMQLCVCVSLYLDIHIVRMCLCLYVSYFPILTVKNKTPQTLCAHPLYSISKCAPFCVKSIFLSCVS